MVLHRAVLEGEDGVVVVRGVDPDAPLRGEGLVRTSPLAEKIDVDVAGGTVPGHGIVQRQPVALEQQHRDPFGAVEGDQIPQGAAVALVVLLRLERQAQPVELRLAERLVQGLGQLRSPLVQGLDAVECDRVQALGHRVSDQRRPVDGPRGEVERGIVPQAEGEETEGDLFGGGHGGVGCLAERTSQRVSPGAVVYFRRILRRMPSGCAAQKEAASSTTKAR